MNAVERGGSGSNRRGDMAAPILSFEDLGLIQGEGWLFRGLDLSASASGWH